MPLSPPKSHMRPSGGPTQTEGVGLSKEQHHETQRQHLGNSSPVPPPISTHTTPSPPAAPSPPPDTQHEGGCFYKKVDFIAIST